MESNIKELLKIPNINESRNYWMVRTNGGIYYDDFSMHQYIAIAWDSISLSYLNTMDETTIKKLIETSEKANPTSNDDDDESEDSSNFAKGKVTSIYNKLHRFVFELGIGDIVLVPNKNSEKIMIAEISGPVYEDPSYLERYLAESPDTEITPCPYYKRRKIHFLKCISKSSMDIYLAKGFNSQHALSNLNEYSSFIDRTIYPIYSKGNEIHSTIHAGHPNGLSLKDLAQLVTVLEKTVNDISDQCELPLSSKDIDVKLNFHSPGILELISHVTEAGIVISIVTFAINNLIHGGNFKISLKRDDLGLDFTLESQNDGIRGSNRKDRELDIKEKELYLQLVKDLDIKSPDLIANIINGDKITPDTLSEITSTEISPAEISSDETADTMN